MKRGKPSAGLAAAPAERRRVTTGLLALIILILNVLVVLWSIWLVQERPEAGYGIPFVYLFVVLPAILLATFLGVMSLVNKSGRVPGAVALTISGAALLASIFGFVATQMM